MLLYFVVIVLCIPFLLLSWLFSAFIFAVCTPLIYCGFALRLFHGLVQSLLAKRTPLRPDSLQLAQRLSLRRGSLSNAITVLPCTPELLPVGDSESKTPDSVMTLQPDESQAIKEKNTKDNEIEETKGKERLDSSNILSSDGNSRPNLRSKRSSLTTEKTIRFAIDEVKSDSWIADYDALRVRDGHSAEEAVSNADKAWNARHTK
ncbi:hypothetical protein BDR26DRAFT_849701 [Obelidium mucronatum]|nr:hypothetical protein BDR26DRAFT_849701 [Obelidium mucronatum]